MICQFSDYFSCKRRCSDEILFICGSDGNNYLNECNFNNARCENPKLKKEYFGPCNCKTVSYTHLTLPTKA